MAVQIRPPKEAEPVLIHNPLDGLGDVAMPRDGKVALSTFSRLCGVKVRQVRRWARDEEMPVVLSHHGEPRVDVIQAIGWASGRFEWFAAEAGEDGPKRLAAYVSRLLVKSPSLV